MHFKSNYFLLIVENSYWIFKVIYIDFFIDLIINFGIATWYLVIILGRKTGDSNYQIDIIKELEYFEISQVGVCNLIITSDGELILLSSYYDYE